MNHAVERPCQAKGILLAIVLPPLTHAMQQDQPEVQFNPIVVEVQRPNNPYLADQPKNSKRTDILLNTPKTTQVLTTQLLKTQNILSLKEALATTPGISFAAGEGGGGYGDKISLRGYDTTSNTTIDGIRDAAWQTRSDLFNVDAVEINKGANGVESGVGQLSGGVNLVSKRPKKKDSTELNAGIGTDAYRRLDMDINRRFNETSAFRLNAMVHEDRYVGRPETRQRYGIAPSITFGLDTDHKLTLALFHQEDDNIPLYGVPYYNGQALPEVALSNYYGFKNLDRQHLNHSNATIRLESRLQPYASIQSITRYSDIKQDNITTAPQGKFCLSDGRQPVAANIIIDKAGMVTNNLSGWIACANKGQYIPSGPRGYVRNTHTRQWAHDTQLRIDVDGYGITHNLIGGIGYSTEDYTLTAGGHLYGQNGVALVQPNIDLYRPTGYWEGPTQFFKTSDAVGNLNIYSAYLIDSMKLNPRWSIHLGTRFDRIEGDYRANSIVPATQAITSTQSAQRQNLTSYSVGVGFKPNAQSSIYFNYANAQKPTQYAAHIGCSNATATAGSTCNTQPEQAIAYELGAKWQPSSALLVSAALFRNEQNKVRVNSAVAGLDAVLDGKNHIDGFELSLAGQIMPKWGMSASASYMQGRYDQTVADGQIDYTKGSKLINVPQASGSIWTTYQMHPKWQIGYGAVYQGKMYLNTPAQTVSNEVKTIVPDSAVVRSDDYWIHNASLTYQPNTRLSMQLMAKNLTNQTYLTHIRNNGWALPGEGRQFILNLSSKF